MKTAAFLAALLFGLLSATQAADVREREPAKATGKVYEWKSKHGLAYYYFIPRSYDPDKGANLTLILHCSNLTRSLGLRQSQGRRFSPR